MWVMRLARRAGWPGGGLEAMQRLEVTGFVHGGHSCRSCCVAS
ncbi:hypothetical protein PCLA_17r0128 [Pseudomonas citronellolis]|nr:hypothetical protein PCLA_17r0128 [Pseudomonas citronellolis]